MPRPARRRGDHDTVAFDCDGQMSAGSERREKKEREGEQLTLDRCCLWWGRGWLDGGVAGLGVHRPEAEGIGRHRRVRAFRHDSLHREDEDDAAQLRTVLDLLLGVPTDGDTAATRGIAGDRERERKGAGSREQVRGKERRGRGAAWSRS